MGQAVWDGTSLKLVAGSLQSPKTTTRVDLGDSESASHLRLSLLSDFAEVGEIEL